LSGGEVTAVTLRRGDQTLELGKGSDREVLLSVGDTLQVQSAVPSAIAVIPFR
jgi:hypothetical protein